MKRIPLLAALLFALTSLAASQQIQGDYVETRSADVYTGQCFANGEVNLVGNEAILGWRVDKGEWNGVALNGLAVVAVVRAKATLGDPYANPYPAKSVLVVDDQATPQQRDALIAFAHHMTGELTANVERVVSAPVSLEVVREHHGTALLRAGNFATVQTRPINEHDHLCGNEITFYPPLTKLSHSMPAVALRDEYRGPALGETWSISDKRSAFIGTFAVSDHAEMASAGD
ncbi:MAG TPA: DUF1326 domain-containing protein [Terriglobales bacterium]|nr:DUF1326 domain-containing protein [Terriglobales bacterium]